MMTIVQYTPIINQVTADLIEYHNEILVEPPIVGTVEYIAIAQAQFPYERQYEGKPVSCDLVTG